MKKKYIACALATALCIQAQWPVIDAAAIVKLVDQIQKMKEQINWLQQQYEVQTNTYRQIIWNAKWLTNKSRWRSAIESWRYPAYGNASGKTGPWNDATRDATKAAGAVISVASRLPNIIDRYGSFGGRDIDDLKRKHYAKLEIMGGTQVNTLEMLADVRSVQQQRNQTVTQLEAQVLSDSELENTEAAMLNKIGAASMISLRNQQDQLKLQAQMVDLLLQNQIRERNSMVDAANREAAFLDGYKATTRRVFGSTTQALSVYKGY